MSWYKREQKESLDKINREIAEAALEFKDDNIKELPPHVVKFRLEECESKCQDLYDKLEKLERTNMTDKELYKKGWWISISPLALHKNETWILGVQRKLKVNWQTELAKDFDCPLDAREYAEEFIRNFKKK